MSIVAYYVEVDAAQLAALRAKPPLVWHMREDPRFAGAAMMDVDQDWQVLSWLASPTKRSETCHHAAATAGGQDAEQVLRVVARLGCRPPPPGDDLLLDAIEGRGEERDHDPALNFGLGGARVFPPKAVRRIAVTFSQFPWSAFRGAFDRETMARMHVGGMDWRQEEDSVRDEFLVPSFVRLSEFYQHAAQAGHDVVVFHL
ncbi:DUF1877 family protein [[Empedobacter] haloabium]|uniref:DUF1877 family protein n=1 Tax=[Empedobacter] haloabium TaxID=592317 RepID=A0ABZ1UEF9_9BURK